MIVILWKCFLRQPPNLRILLCRSYLFQPDRGNKFQRNSDREAPGCKKCGRAPLLAALSPFQPQGRLLDKLEAINIQSKTTGSVKRTTAEILQGEYVGLQARPFRLRLAEHKQHIRIENIDRPSGFHLIMQASIYPTWLVFHWQLQNISKEGLGPQK